jgi:CYTH domain-containing protein
MITAKNLSLRRRLSARDRLSYCRRLPRAEGEGESHSLMREPPAAFVRKRRRDVASTGLLWDMGVFVGGVLCTLLAWAIGFDSVVVRVRAEAEVWRFPSACFYAIRNYDEVNIR